MMASLDIYPTAAKEADEAFAAAAARACAALPADEYRIRRAIDDLIDRAGERRPTAATIARVRRDELRLMRRRPKPRGNLLGIVQPDGTIEPIANQGTAEEPDCAPMGGARPASTGGANAGQATESPDLPTVLMECIDRLREVGTPEAIRAEQSLQRHRLGMEQGAACATPPVDLWQRYEAPQIPAGVLPETVERFAAGHAEIMGADPAGLAMSALAVCAAAITDEIVLQVKTHDPTWRESARLWVGLVGLPSTKKTPLMNAAIAPLRRLDREMALRNAEKMREYEAIPKTERASVPPPLKPRLVVEDATMEALQVVLQDSPHGIFSIQDELSGWFGAMDKYNSGKGSAADRAFWLKAFSGGAYSLDRVVRGSVLLPNLSIGLLGGIQPEPLRKIAGESVDDGLIQRFLPVILRPASEGRDAPAGEVVATYDHLVERLARLRPPVSGNLAKTSPVRFSAEARPIREQVERENVKLVKSLEDVSPKLASHFGKHDGIFARLCLLFHCIEGADVGVAAEISGDTAKRVATFVEDFLRPSAIAFYAGVLGMSAGHEDLLAVAALIVADGLTEIVARDVQRSTRSLRNLHTDEVRRICEKLEAFGWLQPIDPRQRSNSPRWRVVPEVHEIFAERGRIETERRAAAKAALMEALGQKA